MKEKIYIKIKDQKFFELHNLKTNKNCKSLKFDQIIESKN
jgi:hypothetical protein